MGSAGLAERVYGREGGVPSPICRSWKAGKLKPISDPMRSSGAGMTPELSAQHKTWLTSDAQRFGIDAGRVVIITNHVLIVPRAPLTELPWKSHPGLLMISSQ